MLGPELLLTRPQAASASTRIAAAAIGRVALIKLQDRHERLLRDLDRADSLHSLLAFLLLLQQLAFPGHVAAIALGNHVLAHRRDRFPGDDLATNRGLDGDLVQLARNDRLQLLHQPPPLRLRLAAVRDQRERVYGLARDEDVELDELALAEPDHLVVHRGVALAP